MLGGRSKLVIVFAVLVSVALVAAPIAGAGTVNRLLDFGISFDGVYEKGKPVKVKNLVYSNIKLECDGGGHFYSPSKKFPKMKVNKKRKFHGTLEVDGITSKVTGRYAHDLAKVTGTVKASGDTAGFTNCSAKISWTTN